MTNQAYIKYREMLQNGKVSTIWEMSIPQQTKYVRSTQLSMTSFLIVKRVNYCILEVDIVVQSIKELKLTDSM